MNILRRRCLTNKLIGKHFCNMNNMKERQIYPAEDFKLRDRQLKDGMDYQKEKTIRVKEWRLSLYLVIIYYLLFYNIEDIWFPRLYEPKDKFI